MKPITAYIKNKSRIDQAISDGNNLGGWTEESQNINTRIDGVTTSLAENTNYLLWNAINIKIPFHGLSAAKGDGVTDDTQAIQAIIDYVSSNGGGVVFAPVGTYKHSTLFLKNKVYLVGQGKGTQFINSTDSSSIKIGDSVQNIFDTKVSNIYLQGDQTKINQHGIEYYGNNPAYSILDTVYIQYFGGNGIYGGHDGHVNNVEIKGCFISNCIGDGINMQYGIGQINAIWVHHNNIVANNNGILFFGNNVIVESNTVQNNREYAFSLSDRTLSTNKNCFGSAIRNNYTEGNASDVANGASIIGIFSGYLGDGSTNNKLVRNLDISDNYFVESGAKYASVIYCEDLKTSDPSAKNCVINTKNNYAEIPLISFNKPSALSTGCVVDETYFALIPLTMLTSLPLYVEKRGLAGSTIITNVLTMKNGWSGVLRYSKDSSGKVWLRTDTNGLGTGTVYTTLSGTIIATIPTGYLPLAKVWANVLKGNVSPYDVTPGLEIDLNGDIRITKPLSQAIVANTPTAGLMINTIFQA